MEKIKLFEWWLKTHTLEDKKRKMPEGTQRNNWSTVLRTTDNPMEKDFPEVSLNKTGFRKTQRGNTEVVTRSLFYFRNPKDDGQSLARIKKLDPAMAKKIGELVDWGLFNLDYRMARPRDYSVIMFPKSTSQVLNILWEHILLDVYPQEITMRGDEKFQWTPTIFTNAFEKRKCKDVEWDLEKLDKVANPKVRDDVYKQIDKFKNKLADSTPNLKDIYVLHRQFISRFMDIRPAIIPQVESVVPGKGVIILDDFVTHGTTKEEMINLVLEYNPKRILFLSLFDIISGR